MAVQRVPSPAGTVFRQAFGQGQYMLHRIRHSLLLTFYPLLLCEVIHPGFLTIIIVTVFKLSCMFRNNGCNQTAASELLLHQSKWERPVKVQGEDTNTLSPAQVGPGSGHPYGRWLLLKAEGGGCSQSTQFSHPNSQSTKWEMHCLWFCPHNTITVNVLTIIILQLFILQ